jgi:hypothetical protein
LKYWGCFPLETSKRKANATKIPEGKTFVVKMNRSDN